MDYQSHIFLGQQWAPNLSNDGLSCPTSDNDVNNSNNNIYDKAAENNQQHQNLIYPEYSLHSFFPQTSLSPENPSSWSQVALAQPNHYPFLPVGQDVSHDDSYKFSTLLENEESICNFVPSNVTNIDKTTYTYHGSSSSALLGSISNGNNLVDPIFESLMAMGDETLSSATPNNQHLPSSVTFGSSPANPRVNYKSYIPDDFLTYPLLPQTLPSATPTTHFTVSQATTSEDFPSYLLPPRTLGSAPHSTIFNTPQATTPSTSIGTTSSSTTSASDSKSPSPSTTDLSMPCPFAHCRRTFLKWNEYT